MNNRIILNNSSITNTNASLEFLGNPLDMSVDIDDGFLLDKNGTVLRSATGPIKSLRTYFKEHLHPIANGKLLLKRNAQFVQSSNLVNGGFAINSINTEVDPKEVERIVSFFYKEILQTCIPSWYI